MISRLMGHGSTDITYKLYSHFYPDPTYTPLEGLDYLMGQSAVNDATQDKVDAL